MKKVYLKQLKVFQCLKVSGKESVLERVETETTRMSVWDLSPREAIDRTRIDKKCPITDKVSIRGCFVAGAGHSAKMVRIIII